MTNCLKAVAFSLFAHGLAAVALAFWFSHTPSVELPSLDLSAVELSFAQEEREAPAVPPPPPEPEPPPPKPEPEPEPPSPEPPPPEPTPPEPQPEPTPPPEPEPEPTSPEPPPPEPTPPEPQPEPLPPPPPQPEPLPPPPKPEPPPILPRDDRISRKPEPKPEPPPILPRDAPISREPAPQAPKQAHIDAQPRPLKTIRPDYPVAARKRGVEGDVTLELDITEKGRVSSAKVVESSGHDDLDAAAVRAATKAQFVPAKAGKNAVSSVARITISFRLTSR